MRKANTTPRNMLGGQARVVFEIHFRPVAGNGLVPNIGLDYAVVFEDGWLTC